MQIYRIFNKKNNKSYIGMTKWTFEERYPQGKWWKWTHSPHLKRAMEKYGLDCFGIEILNESAKTEDELSKLEKLYIKQYNSLIPHGYNLTNGGGSENPSFEKEYELIDAYGTIYKIKNLSNFCRKNKLNYGAMLNMVSGLNASSSGFALSTTPIELITNPNQEWELEEIKTGQIFKVKRKDMPEFSRRNNINIKNLWRIVNKKTYVSHGFKLKETVLSDTIRPEPQKYKNIKFINPMGEEVIIENIYVFCKENGLDRKGFYQLISGKSLLYQGWRLPYEKNEFKEKRELRFGKYIKIKNIQTNQIVEIKNISKFCRDNKLNLNDFNSMIRGTIKQYMGFSLPETDLTNYKYPKKIIYISLINKHGEIIEGMNSKDIENKYKIMTSQSIQNLVNNKRTSTKGWAILQVRYYMDYYPKINNNLF